MRQAKREAATGDATALALAFFESSPTAAVVLDSGTLCVVSANPSAAALYGYRSAAEMEGVSYYDLAGDSVPVWAGAATHYRRDGSAVRVEVESSLAGETGTGHRFLSLRPHRDDAAEPRWRILEMVARYERLETVLDRIVETLELRCPGLVVSAMLVHDGKLYHAAGGRVPPEMQDALDGLPMESCEPAGLVTPCWGTPATPVEIGSAPRWLPWRELVLGAGLACCWSEPVVSGAGEVLGVLAAYLGRVRPLDRNERHLLQGLANLAAIAIEQRNLTADLDYQAHHDPVTRLPNRGLFEDRLRQAITLANRAGTLVGVLHVQLDRFPTTASLLGKPAGDLLLEQVARRVETALRATDTLTLSGVHDFDVILPGIASAADALAASRRVHSALSAPFEVMQHELAVTASIGVAVHPAHGSTHSTLVLNAETAAQEAWRHGRNCVQSFEPEMNARTQQRLLIESGLGRAVARGELQLMFQPEIDVREARVVGAEALLRWKHPAIGTVSPGAFIPVAEETGQIAAIGRWSMTESCRQAAAWAFGYPGAPPRVAVNVSGVQLCRGDFVETVASALRETGLPAASLEIELTESALVQDLERISARMEALRALGVSIALDDFGTGYNGLSYLRQLPVDKIKVDRSFIQQIADPYDYPALTASIISMARALGKRVVAEGVETFSQESALVAMGCDVQQGFRFGHPVDGEAFARTWLSEGQAAH